MIIIEHLSDYFIVPLYGPCVKRSYVTSTFLAFYFLTFLNSEYSEYSSFITCFYIDLNFSRIVYYFAIP